MAKTGSLYRAASPIAHVSLSSAPVLLLHGDADETVPDQQSVCIHRGTGEAIGAFVGGAAGEALCHVYWKWGCSERGAVCRGEFEQKPM